MTAALEPSLSRANVARQGVLLLSGYAAAQILSFARNALIGHWLSKGDFGIAASITLVLQLLETVSDLGADRLIVQAGDGDDPRLVASGHSTLVARGGISALLLYLAAGPIVAFFSIPEARWAFEAAALIPLVKGFQHLDPRRFQRRLLNRAQMIVEAGPQAIALAATLPMLTLAPGYDAVLWLAILQAVSALLISQLLAERAYALALDSGHLARLVAFGWPIWLSAFPLIAVYQGDRFIIGRLLGMEGLAAFTTAFMVTMVPGLVAAKVGHALLLPLFAGVAGDHARLVGRFRVASETVATAAAIYLAGFLVAGGGVVALAFGPQYAGLDLLVAWLATMWSLRMIQAVPGMALMATGETRPFLVAGLLRAAALPAAYLAARDGLGLTGVAAAGVAGELASLVYIALRAERAVAGLGRALAVPTLLLTPAGLLAASAAMALPAGAGLGAELAAAGAVSIIIILMALIGLRQTRQLALGLLSSRPAAPRPIR
ncbi:MAG: oligosaccharide flippase family protein [Pseudomonadota bacterium]